VKQTNSKERRKKKKRKKKHKEKETDTRAQNSRSHTRSTNAHACAERERERERERNVSFNKLLIQLHFTVYHICINIKINPNSQEMCKIFKSPSNTHTMPHCNTK